MLNYQYSEYNINIISLNYVINEYVETSLQSYCYNNNININPKSRDVQKLLQHFIALHIIQTLQYFQNTRNLLNYNMLTLSIIDSNMTNIFDKRILQTLRKFKLCYINHNQSINSFDIQQLYHIKSIADNCNVKIKSLNSIKKYIASNELNHLQQMINKPSTQLALAK